MTHGVNQSKICLKKSSFEKRGIYMSNFVNLLVLPSLMKIHSIVILCSGVKVSKNAVKYH